VPFVPWSPIDLIDFYIVKKDSDDSFPLVRPRLTSPVAP